MQVSPMNRTILLAAVDSTVHALTLDFVLRLVAIC
jgi:hypothetical protein